MKNIPQSQKLQEPTVALTDSTSTEIFVQAGRIVMSTNVGQSMKEMRKGQNIKQNELARRLGVTASVLSDYEKGRRPSPGARFIRDYILACMGNEVKKVRVARK